MILMDVTSFIGEIEHWNYNLDTYRQIQSLTWEGIQNPPVLIENIPEAYIENKVILPEDAASYRRAYKDIIDGKERSECIVHMYKQKPKRYELVRIVLTRQYNSKNKERIASGICLNLENDMVRLPQNMLSLTPGGMHRCYLANPIHLEFASDGLCKMSGYTREEFDAAVGDIYTRLILEEDQPLFIAFIQELAKAPKVRTVEYRIVRKDGSILYVSDTMESILGEDGILYGYSSVTDITPLKEEQKKLQRQEQEYEDLYQQLKETHEQVVRNTQQLRYEIMSSAIPGGMMGGYLEEGFPFYFINQRMLQYWL